MVGQPALGAEGLVDRAARVVARPLTHEVADRVVEEDQEEQQQHHAVGAADLVRGAAQYAIEGHHDRRRRREQHHGDLAGDHHTGDEDGAHQRRASDDHADVGHVRAEDVAEGDVAAALERRDQVHRELRRAGACGDDGEADHEGRYAEGARHSDRPAHDRLPTYHEECQAEDQPQQVGSHPVAS